MSQIELEQEKKELMNEILDQLSTWTGEDTEEAEQILAVNEQTIERMQEIDQQLTKEQLAIYNKMHQKDWATIIEKQEALIQWIRSARQKTSEQLTQTGNKEKVISSYIGLQKESGLMGKNY